MSGAKLTAAGLGAAHALVGENLGTPAEAIRFGLARELAEQTFAPLSVLLIEREALPSRRTPGLPDDAFIRGAVPMTKQEVRAAALAKLAVTPTDTLWDVGAGTGSVSVELALAAPRGHVYAVECTNWFLWELLFTTIRTFFAAHAHKLIVLGKHFLKFLILFVIIIKKRFHGKAERMAFVSSRSSNQCHI